MATVDVKEQCVAHRISTVRQSAIQAATTALREKFLSVR